MGCAASISQAFSAASSRQRESLDRDTQRQSRQRDRDEEQRRSKQRKLQETTDKETNSRDGDELFEVCPLPLYTGSWFFSPVVLPSPFCIIYAAALFLRSLPAIIEGSHSLVVGLRSPSALLLFLFFSPPPAASRAGPSLPCPVVSRLATLHASTTPRSIIRLIFRDFLLCVCKPTLPALRHSFFFLTLLSRLHGLWPLAYSLALARTGYSAHLLWFCSCLLLDSAALLNSLVLTCPPRPCWAFVELLLLAC